MADTLHDEALDYHRHPTPGKLAVVPTKPLANQHDLSLAYSPGVAAASTLIANDPKAVSEVTARGNLVAVITNGTAVLGLGDIGALAGLPVMEGKAALFAELVDLSGVPILLKTRDADSVVASIMAIEQSFGAIQLEDFAAPECFEIESRLRALLEKPVLHDDQHGTAVVTLAALMTATRRLGRSLRASTVGQIGLGAAGHGIVRLLRAHGVGRVLGADRNPAAIARIQAMGAEGATLPDIMERCDIVIATTGVKNLIPAASVRPGQIIFALSNPEAEIDPLEAMERGAAFAADGKGINNVLAFPGLFRGALAAHAPRFTDTMLMAAAEAISQLAGEDLVPNPLDKAVHERVAAAVMTAALQAES